MPDHPRFDLLGPESTGFGLGGRRLSPFVGREIELRFLLERLGRVRDGLGQMVWITGEPGVGKSRLLFEFRQRLDKLGIRCFEGRCAFHGADVPFYLLRDVLRTAWNLPENPDELLAAVGQHLDSLRFRDAESAAILANWLGADVPVPTGITPEDLRQRAFDVLRDVFRASSLSSACVLLLEDLHWIDRSSDDFLDALLDHLPGSRLFVVLSARSGHAVRSTDRSFVSRVALPPLNSEESLTLALDVLPPSARSADLVSRIIERSEGNPFFLEELLWAVGDGADDHVPETVTQALTVRMDRLDPGQRITLETAAVLGREVPLPLLTVMCAEEADLLRVLDVLVRLEFFYLTPGPTYVFKHALTQDVAYGRLTSAEQQQHHAAAGRAFEMQAPHRLGELAYHWDRTDDHVKAIDYLTRFAEQATARYALSEAVTATHHAVTHCNALPPGPGRDRRTVMSVMQLTLPLTLLGRTREIHDALYPYLPLVERLGDARVAAPFFFSLTFAADHTADHDAAETFGARAIEEAHLCRDLITEGHALVMLSFSSMWSSQLRQGVERARRAVECLEVPAEGFWRGHGLFTQSQLLLMLGDVEAARQVAETLSALGEMIGDRRLQAYGVVCLATETMMRRDTTQALANAKRALEIACDPLGRAAVLGYLAEIAVEADEIVLAKDSLAEALAFSRAAHFRQVEAWNLARQAEAEIAGGDLIRADEVASDAIRLAEALGFPYIRGRAEHVRGRVALSSAAVADAMRWLTSAASIFTSIEARYEWVRTTLSLATAHATSGDAEAAVRLRNEAFEMAARLGTRLN